MKKGRKWTIVMTAVLTLALLAGCGAGNDPATSPVSSGTTALQTEADSKADPGSSTQADPAETTAQLPSESSAEVPPESTAPVPPASSEVPPASSEVPPETAPPETVPPVTETPLGEDIIENSDGSRLIRRYDPEGRLVEEIRTASDGTQLSSKKIIYYPGGTVVKWIFEETRKTDGSLRSSSESAYYENGSIKSLEERAADGSSSLTQYDENGREILQQKKNKDGVTVSTVTQTYYEDGACASRITEKRDDKGAVKERTEELFYENGVTGSVEKTLSDGRRLRTGYNSNGIRILYEEYDSSGQIRLRNRWEYYDDGTIAITSEEAWNADGSYKSATAVQYSTGGAIVERQTIREDQPDRMISESFDENGRLLRRQETLLDGSFVSSVENVYYTWADQLETTEEIWLENDATCILKRTFTEDGTPMQVFQQKADGTTITTDMNEDGKPAERLIEDRYGGLIEKLTWEYYESGETWVLESYYWNEDSQGYETYREEYTEDGDTYLESHQYADGSGVVRRYDQPGRLAQYEEYFPNGSLKYAFVYLFFNNSDVCSRYMETEGDENGKTLAYSDTEYYDDGSVKKSYDFYGVTEVTREYNKAGNLVLYTYEEDDILLRKEQYYYKTTDPDALMEENIQVWNADGSVDFHEINEYGHSNGRKSTHTYIYSDGSWEFKKYDDKGRLILDREVLPSNIVVKEREIDPDNQYERVRKNYSDGYLKSDYTWINQQLRSRTEYYESHAVRVKETRNEDGTGEIREYSETGWLVWMERTTKDWVVEVNYKEGRRTYERYADRNGNFMKLVVRTYYTEGGEKLIRIEVTESDNTSQTKIIKDDGKIGYGDP